MIKPLQESQAILLAVYVTVNAIWSMVFFFKESYWQLEDLKAILIGLHWPQELLASDSEGTGEGKLA